MTTQPTQAKNRIAEELDFLRTASEIEVSIVVPLYNEEPTLAALVDRIAAALPDRRFEIVFIDDGSRDGSWAAILALAAQHPSLVRGYRLRSNSGKAEALATGFAHASGRKVVTIDADLQDDPSEIPALLAKLDEGYDLVSGWKQRRQDPWSKTVPSRFFNFASRAASGLKLHDFNCGLKAYRREALANLRLYGELHRFIPILVQADGFRVAELPVRHFPRQHGVSKYGWTRLVKGFLDLLTVVMLTRYLKRPGHFFGGIGLAAGAAGLSILGYLSFMKIVFGEDIGARPLFFLGMLLVLFSGQMVSTGIIGEFLLRHHSPENAPAPRVAVERTDQAN